MKLFSIILIASSIIFAADIYPIINGETTTSTLQTLSNADPDWDFSFSQVDVSYDNTYWGISKHGTNNDTCQIKIYQANGDLNKTIDSTGLSYKFLNNVKDIQLFQAENNLINYIIVVTKTDTLYSITCQNNAFSPQQSFYFPHTIKGRIKQYGDSLFILKEDSLFSLYGPDIDFIENNVDAFYINSQGTWTTKNTTLYLNGNSIKTIQSSIDLYVSDDSTAYTIGTDYKFNHDNENLLIQTPTGSTPDFELIQFHGIIENDLWMTVRYEPVTNNVFDTILIKLDVHSKDSLTFYNFSGSIFNYGINIELTNKTSAIIGSNNSIQTISLNHKPIATSTSQTSINYVNYETKRIKLAYGISVTDDNHSTFTYSIIGEPSWFSTPTSGPSFLDTLDVTNVDTGTYTISIEISDGSLKDTTEFSFTVYNDQINITKNLTITESENGQAHYDTITTDKDAYISPSTILPDFITITKITGTLFRLVVSPKKSDSGSNPIQIILTDSTNYTNCGTERGFTYDTIDINYTVNYVNHDPVLALINGQSSVIGLVLWSLLPDTIICTFYDNDNEDVTMNFISAESLNVSISGDTIFTTPNADAIKDTITCTKIIFSYTDGEAIIIDTLPITIALLNSDTSSLITFDTLTTYYDTTSTSSQTIITDSAKIIQYTYITWTHNSIPIKIDTTKDSTYLVNITSNNFPVITNTENTININTNDSITFTLDVTDDDPLTYDYTIDNNNITITKNDNQYTIKGISDGTTSCTLKVSDNLKTVNFIITITISTPSGIRNNINTIQKPYFNFNNGNISYGLPNKGKISINIYTINGKKIKSINTTKYAGHHNIKIKSSTGFYIYRIQIADLKLTKKAIIVH